MSDVLGDKLAKLAESILDAASVKKDDPFADDEAIPLETKIDIFKAVSTYHVAYTRAKMKTPDPSDTPGVNFDEFRSAVDQAQANSGGAGAGGSAPGADTAKH